VIAKALAGNRLNGFLSGRYTGLKPGVN